MALLPHHNHERRRTIKKKITITAAVLIGAQIGSSILGLTVGIATAALLSWRIFRNHYIISVVFPEIIAFIALTMIYTAANR